MNSIQEEFHSKPSERLVKHFGVHEFIRKSLSYLFYVMARFFLLFSHQ
ncbi:hypothetical protein Goshw_017571, partial [Gossypium schwendimanii]|nr:hypothetical protein [Gossypium schwendimanii]